MYNCAHLTSTKESLTIEYLRIIFFRGGEKECGRKIFGERKDTFLKEKKKEENIWRGKCHQGRTKNEGKIWILFE